MSDPDARCVARDDSPLNAIDARQRLVVGKPPRIGPLNTPAVIEAAIRSTQELRRAAGSTTPVTADAIPEFVTTLLRHPDLYRRLVAVSMQVQGRGVLAARDRQLAILRKSWLCQSPYVWGEHVKHSKRVGISSEEIERVTLGSSVSGWNEHERALLVAVEDLHADAMISNAAWDVLKQGMDERQLIELPILVGQFTTMMYLQNSLRMRLRPDNMGLRAR